MEKREKILLTVLGVVAMVAVIIFVAVSAKPSQTSDLATDASKKISSESIMTALSQAKAVMASSKFSSLATFGKVPVVVESFEMGNKQPLIAATTAISPTAQ